MAARVAVAKMEPFRLHKNEESSNEKEEEKEENEKEERMFKSENGERIVPQFIELENRHD